MYQVKATLEKRRKRNDKRTRETESKNEGRKRKEK